jgi:hypothetical protein
MEVLPDVPGSSFERSYHGIVPPGEDLPALGKKLSERRIPLWTDRQATP